MSLYRTPLIAGNWKMYKTVPEAVDTARKLAHKLADCDGVEVMIAPPFTTLTAMAATLADSPIALGGQNLFWEPQGAYTGEISAEMLVSAGCRFVIVGHSERRQIFGETDEAVNRKIRAALRAELAPVMCVGETEQERENDKTFSILDKQVQKGLQGFVPADLKALVIAYEPVWAIGTGKTATARQAQEVHQYLRSRIEALLSTEMAAGMRIVYGGSVKPNNIAELMSMPDIDGALVGGASLDADTFSAIVQFESSQNGSI